MVEPNQQELPEWLALITDEAQRKAVWEKAQGGWMQDADYRKKTMALADQQKAWEQEKQQMAAQIAQWGEVYTYLSPHWEDVKRWIAAKANGNPNPASPQAQPPATTNPNGRYFENWDVLTPEQQAERHASYIRDNVLAAEIAKNNKLWMSELARREEGYQRYLNYLTDGFTRQVKDPNFNLQGYLDNAIKFTYGQFDPKELAYKATMGEVDQKKLQDEWFKKGREEAALEFKNSQQKPEVSSPGMLPNFIKRQPSTDTDRETAVRQAAAEKGIPW